MDHKSPDKILRFGVVGWDAYGTTRNTSVTFSASLGGGSNGFESSGTITITVTKGGANFTQLGNTGTSEVIITLSGSSSIKKYDKDKLPTEDNLEEIKDTDEKLNKGDVLYIQATGTITSPSNAGDVTIKATVEVTTQGNLGTDGLTLGADPADPSSTGLGGSITPKNDTTKVTISNGGTIRLQDKALSALQSLTKNAVTLSGSGAGDFRSSASITITSNVVDFTKLNVGGEGLQITNITGTIINAGNELKTTTNLTAGTQLSLEANGKISKPESAKDTIVSLTGTIVVTKEGNLGDTLNFGGGPNRQGVTGSLSLETNGSIKAGSTLKIDSNAYTTIKEASDTTSSSFIIDEIIRNELERMLDIDMKLYGIENPRYNPDLKNIPEVIETMRDQIKELFGDNSTLFRGVTDYDLVSLSVTLSDLIWEYNFYKHKAKLKFDPDIIKLLRTNFTFINELFNDLIITRMNTIKLLKIPNLIDQPIFSHPLDIFPFLYLQQFQHSIKDFFSWYQYTFNFISDTVSPVTVLGHTATNSTKGTTNSTEVTTGTTGASTVTEGNETNLDTNIKETPLGVGEETGTVTTGKGANTVVGGTEAVGGPVTVTEEEINTMTMIINDDIKNILENLMGKKLSLIINGKYPLAIEEIGGYRPYIKFELEDSENPSSIKGYHKKYADRQLEFEQIEDIITPEVKEKFKEIQEEFKMFKHMSLKDLSLHYCKKFNSEYNFAHRIINRYNILKSINPPVTVLGQTDRVVPDSNSTEDSSSNSSTTGTVGPSTVTEGNEANLDTNSNETTLGVGTEESDAVGASTVMEDTITEFEKKLLDIITCLNYHIMNIRHMSWFVECSNSLPIECLANLKQTKQNIANPKPKTIFFFSHNFPKAFNTILEFIIPTYYNNNLKIHYSGGTEHTEGSESIEDNYSTESTMGKGANSTAMECTSGKGANSTLMECTNGTKNNKSIIYRKRILEEVYNMSKKRIDRSYEDTFPIGMDEDYKLKDIDLLRDLIDIGAGFKIYSDMPFTGYPMDILIDPDITDELRHSAYFKLAQSQPKPIYKCKNCNYLVFGNRVRLRRSRKIVCYEFEELRDDPKYTCRNCGLGRKQFDVIYRTGEKKYQLPPYIHLEQSPKFTNKRLK